MKPAMKTKKAFLLLACAMIFALATVGQAGADTLILKPDVEFSVNTPPVNTPPWITATFDDSINGTNTVRLTMAADNLTGDEFISKWFFNFDGDVNQLTFSHVSGDTYNALERGVGNSNNKTKADGDGYFDFAFYFLTDAASRFNAGETVEYNITYNSAITASSFNLFSQDGGGNGAYLTAAHVQGIAPTEGVCGNGSAPIGGTCSGWVGTTAVAPEPVSSTLFIIGGATLGFRRFRKKV